MKTTLLTLLTLLTLPDLGCMSKSASEGPNGSSASVGATDTVEVATATAALQAAATAVALPADRNCAPTTGCTYGPKCGDKCCGAGEWCDTSAAPTCRCGVASACTEGNSCYSNLPQANKCGGVCCFGSGCPVSRRAAKREIEPVSAEQREELYAELRAIQLSTYQYRDQPKSAPRRLGFIIDDTNAPAAIAADGNHVDLYGYISMAVGAVQIQAREIEALKARINELEAARPQKHDKQAAP
jgi:hypothetical protein